MNQGNAVVEALLKRELADTTMELQTVRSRLSFLHEKTTAIQLLLTTLGQNIAPLPSLVAPVVTPAPAPLPAPAPSPPTTRNKRAPTRDVSWRTAAVREMLTTLYQTHRSIHDIKADLVGRFPELTFPDTIALSNWASIGLHLRRPPGYDWRKPRVGTVSSPVAASPPEPVHVKAEPELPVTPDLPATTADDAAFKTDLIGISSKLYAFAIKLTHDRDRAQDLTQQTLLRAWEHRAQFTPDTNLTGWTFIIMKNQYFSELRSLSSKNTIEDVDGAHAATLARSPDQLDHLEFLELADNFEKLVPEHRDALLAVAVNGQEYEEAALEEGCALGTMKSRVNRARAKLAEMTENPPQHGQVNRTRVKSTSATDGASPPERLTRAQALARVSSYLERRA